MGTTGCTTCGNNTKGKGLWGCTGAGFDLESPLSPKRGDSLSPAAWYPKLLNIIEFLMKLV